MYGGMCTTEENWCTMISTVSERAAAKDGDQARLSWHLPRTVLDRVRARLSSLSKLICKEKNNHNVKKHPEPAPAMSRTIRDIWPFSDSSFDDGRKIICE